MLDDLNLVNLMVFEEEEKLIYEDEVCQLFCYLEDEVTL